MGSFFILRCFLLFFFLLFFFLFNGAYAAAGNIWTRTEMVEMAGYGEQKLSSVIITGLFSATLHVLTFTPSPFRYFPTFFFMLFVFHPTTYMIPTGATVAIKCHTGFNRRSKWIKAVTDDLGEFKIDLPSQLHAIPDLENTRFIKPVYVPKPYRCYHTYTNIHKRIKLVSSTNGLRVYTSGKIRLQGYSSRS